MVIRRRGVLGGLAAVAAGPLAAQGSGGRGAELIQADVCVLGGGSSGIYAAVRLQDQGCRVTVVERSGRIGGHAETFRVGGVPIDIGVIVFTRNAQLDQYFQRLGVATTPASFPPGLTYSADFETGQAVTPYAPSPAEVGTVLFTYLSVVQSQFGYLDLNGYQLPATVPPQLLMPFGQFAALYGLKALLPTFAAFGQGIGDLLDVPAVYVLKLLGTPVVSAILGLQGGFLTVQGGASVVYEKAAAVLGRNVLLDASVTRVQRTPGKVQVFVSTPQGLRIIQAKRLVVTIPPLLPAMQPFDLTAQERRLFGQFVPKLYNTSVVELSGLPLFAAVDNVRPDSAAHPGGIPRLPGTFGIVPTGVAGLWSVKYGAVSPLSNAQVQQAIRADIERLTVTGSPVRLQRFATYKSHVPFALQVSPQAIGAGFYAALNALQGQQGTHYAGAAFQTHNSAVIWSQAEEVASSVLQAL